MWTCRVGEQPSQARYFVQDESEVHALVSTLATLSQQLPPPEASSASIAGDDGNASVVLEQVRAPGCLRAWGWARVWRAVSARPAGLVLALLALCLTCLSPPLPSSPRHSWQSST
eukprot:5822409-Prymnesium_polylepis.1